MIIVTVAYSPLPAGVTWPGSFVMFGPQTLLHILNPATLAAYRALGLPEKTVTYAEYVLLGGK